MGSSLPEPKRKLSVSFVRFVPLSTLSFKYLEVQDFDYLRGCKENFDFGVLLYNNLFPQY
jgi:hypothetical protein